MCVHVRASHMRWNFCVCKHVKQHRRLSFRTFDSAKVRKLSY